MNDIAAVAGQLAELRASLQQTQLELEGTVLLADAERIRSTQFINQLILCCYGIDRELDSQLTQLQQTLRSDPLITSLDRELLALEKRLQQHSVALQKSMSLSQAARITSHR